MEDEHVPAGGDGRVEPSPRADGLDRDDVDTTRVVGAPVDGVRPTISVICGTFGDSYWEDLADERAMPSADCQTLAPEETIHLHRKTLHEARNEGAEMATGDWLAFLDADDELDERFIEAMTAVISGLEGDWLVRPATFGIRADGVEDAEAIVLEEVPLLQRNFMVIATLVRREQFLRVGGFVDWPMYEDWDLWLRCHFDGAQFTSAPDAIYRIHVRDQSRNTQNEKLQIATYNQIKRQYTRSGTRPAKSGRPRRRSW